MDNSRYKLTCWHCGESLIGVEPIAIAPVVSTPEPTTITWERKMPPPEKPASLFQLVFSVGIFFLIILAASGIFQVMQPVSRIIYIAGMISGFSSIYFKTSTPSSTNPEEGENSSGDPFPNWLILLIGIPFLILIFALLLALMFGAGFVFEFLIDLFINKDGAERILALVLGAGLGVLIELSMGYVLRTIAHLK